MNRRIKKTILAPMDLLYKISPESTTKILYRLKTGRKLNLNNPRTYSEKLQWIKLHYKDKLAPRCADKYTVRKFVKQCGCEEILIKLLWQGYNPYDIPFDELPQKFVIKVTHGSGGNIICRDKCQLNIPKTIKTLKRRLNEKYLPCYGEWFYGIIKPRIIIEEYLEDEKGCSPIDYKIYCFHGNPKYIIAHVDRFTNHRSNMYDLDWNPIQNITMKEIDSSLNVERPEKLELLLDYARILSEKFIHVRVDLYLLQSKIYFGELTFTSDAGFVVIDPIEIEEKIGSWIKLPKFNFME
ncbi:ATP-grasp fold amidoligase family protein [Anaerocolumna aminovalerica]|uniref:TupA-like ATPgrasp n=1 Tax=Anaerocolumna aminovalerica TaxID=1527 RepID=A0A1I5HK26_9FIRM|nr:ATP-grasp fold amidoligase family protein [Anaerocolumna aminovalerica]SFO48201.1 TupA-like ATPgrasp [Anaerocolumna aminovalerica]